MSGVGLVGLNNACVAASRQSSGAVASDAARTQSTECSIPTDAFTPRASTASPSRPLLTPQPSCPPNQAFPPNAQVGATACVGNLSSLALSVASDAGAQSATGLEGVSNGRVATEDGVAVEALRAMSGTKVAADGLRIARAALDEAQRVVEFSGNARRLQIMKSLQAAVAVPTQGDRFHATVARKALDLVARRPEPEPGELAAAGLEMVDGAYWFDSITGIGNVILDGLEALAALDNDRVFVPAQVAQARQRISAQTTDKGRVDTLRASLKELANLRGEAFRKALIAALQNGPAPNAPKVEQGGDFIIINGIKVPRSGGAHA